ncbi:MAG: hypothetical protein D6743_13955 [Calditrichaeota bacterium]|nr:MAG: hypothetical protein D6743_13955 [Calditrichota bacterium]
MLVHFDAFYSNGILESFLRMISESQRTGEISPEHFGLHFINGHPDRRLITSLQLRAMTTYSRTARSSRAQAIARQRGSGILFIQRAAGNGFIPDRFFRYLSLGKPVLALVPNPIVYHDRIPECYRVYVADVREYVAMRDAFLRMYRDWLTARTDEGKRITVVPRDWVPQPNGPAGEVVKLTRAEEAAAVES